METQPEIFRPTRAEVEALKPGDLAMCVFGRRYPVASIFARGDDINGKAYVCFYINYISGSQLSGSYKEGEIIRTLPLCNKYTSAQIDALEAAKP